MELGATPDAGGTSFAVESAVATRVQLCLVDPNGLESDRIDLACSGGIWSGHVGGVREGQHYGLRVHGPHDAQLGHGCDPTKLLIDPAARRLDGELNWCDELLRPGVDSGPWVPRSVVVAPQVPMSRLLDAKSWADQVVYEAHVGHLSARHRGVAAQDRGRYAALAAPPIVEHLQALGITAIELMPVQHFVSEQSLANEGLRNVWGYNPLAWGAPHAGYARPGGDPVSELRAAVAALHEAGIEVWLDVVFNHTCEGAFGSGPTLSWRGFDNAGTYRLAPGPSGRRDDDVTGCGNTVDVRSAAVRRQIVSSLVRWVRDFGIDGFRFDLAASLIRGGALLADMRAEPALQDARLIAEPWDLGPDGYAIDRFPAPWRIWNDGFREGARQTWLNESPDWSKVASCLTGSGEVFDDPQADHEATVGINAVTTHDGLTLSDLSGDPARSRALLAMVLVSQGIPMISSGDELGRSQGGSTDGYTLEPERWGLDWEGADRSLLGWLVSALAERSKIDALRDPEWVRPGDPNIAWERPDGQPLGERDWVDPALGGMAMVRGGVRVLVVSGALVRFALGAGTWQVAIDSTNVGHRGTDAEAVSGSIAVTGPAVIVLVADL